MGSAKLLEILTSLTVSHAILPRAVCFAASRPANHAICSFIDSRGYASGLIRRCLFIDYIINCITIVEKMQYWQEMWPAFKLFSKLYFIFMEKTCLHIGTNSLLV